MSRPALRRCSTSGGDHRLAWWRWLNGTHVGIGSEITVAIVVFRSAKERPFAERKPTLVEAPIPSQVTRSVNEGIGSVSEGIARNGSSRSPSLTRRVSKASAIGRWLACAVCLSMLWGCRTAAPALVGLPKLSTLENEHLHVRSDLKLPKDHPILRDLDGLRDEIADELNLPVQKQPVTVYLFSDELRYAQYLQTRYPLLPPRRAYFVGTAKELAVYTFWGERIQEDLRHEYTHGVLHASLMDVPLWLDEGLAEYFEVTSQPRGLNRDYAMRLAGNLSQGWKPDLDRLESLEKVDDMQKGDYMEAWAWVHFLLHHSDETRHVLVGYLHELRSDAKPGLLSKRLRDAIPTAEQRFAVHAASLTSGLQQVGGIQDSPGASRH